MTKSFDNSRIEVIVNARSEKNLKKTVASPKPADCRDSRHKRRNDFADTYCYYLTAS